MKISPPLAIYSLGGMLRQQGYDVTIRDPKEVREYYYDTWDEAGVDRFIAGFDLIGISTNTFNWGIAKEFIDIVKSKHNSPVIVAGGVHASLFHEYISKNSEVDFVVREDGEEALLRIVQAIEKGFSFDDIPNITFKKNGQLKINPINQEVALPDYPTAYDLIPDNYYYSIPVETSRGCPFHCAFCAILYLGKWRSLNAEKAIDRFLNTFSYVKNKSTAASLLFTDDEFCINSERAKRIFHRLENIKQKFHIHFTARISDFLRDPELAAAIPKSKVSTIQMGLESGYEEGMQRIKQGLNFEQVDRVFRLLNEHDVSKYCLVSFIVGFPWERYSDCVKTIEYALHIEEKYRVITTVNWWMPLKSELWDEQAAGGFYIGHDLYDNPLWPTNEEMLNIV
ncbi:MAG: radical SAM protein, partial [Desulfobacteraceae bacterium]